MSKLALLAQQGAPDAGGWIAFFGGLWLVMVILGLVGTIFWVWMLIDCLRSSLPSTEKLIWAIVIIFLSVLGALLYFFLARPGRRGTV